MYLSTVTNQNFQHDVDITKWATTVQSAVDAIRKTGCSQRTHKILLPGNDWTHATSFVSDGSAAALQRVHNLDGTIANLIFDVHAYLDGDGSGTSTSCSTNNAAAFSSLGDWLRSNKRQAMLTETGGGANDDGCVKLLGEQLDTMNKYSDVYLGWVGWAAGKFDGSYALTETPVQNGKGWTDVKLVKEVIAGKFKKAAKS